MIGIIAAAAGVAAVPIAGGWPTASHVNAKSPRRW